MPNEETAKAGGLWKAVERIALKSLSTGNFGWFVLMAISIFAIYKLDSTDLKEVLLRVVATLGWLGYPVAGITVFVSMKTLRWREQFYKDEIERMGALRNIALQGKLELPLTSSVETKPTNAKHT